MRRQEVSLLTSQMTLLICFDNTLHYFQFYDIWNISTHAFSFDLYLYIYISFYRSIYKCCWFIVRLSGRRISINFNLSVNLLIVRSSKGTDSYILLNSKYSWRRVEIMRLISNKSFSSVCTNRFSSSFNFFCNFATWAAISLLTAFLQLKTANLPTL